MSELALALPSDRAVLRVSGAEAGSFLQGMVTADIEHLASGGAGYGALLTPQGKILFDFLILARNDGSYLLDTPAGNVADLAKRLGFYKLRAKVSIEALEDCRVVALWHEDGAPTKACDGLFHDPRLPDLGLRGLLTHEDARMLEQQAGIVTATPQAYEAHRIALGVPQAPDDIVYGETFPHDAGLDGLNGVSFDKGCYVGQEVVSRMKHRGTARRRPVRVSSATALPPAGTELLAGDKPVGTLSSVFGTQGIALVRLDRAQDQTVTAASGTVELTLPEWAVWDWPAGGEADSL